MSTMPPATHSTPPAAPEPQRPGVGLDDEFLAELRRDFGRDPAHRLAQNAVTQTTVIDVALNREIVTRADEDPMVTEPALRDPDR